MFSITITLSDYRMLPGFDFSLPGLGVPSAYFQEGLLMKVRVCCLERCHRCWVAGTQTNLLQYGYTVISN